MIGRIEELSELRERYNSNKFEFGIVFGSRRIGKTTILMNFAEEMKGFIYQAKDAEYVDNLRSFSKGLRKYMGFNDSYVYPSFEEAFDDIIAYSKKHRFLLIIDEFPYLCKSNKALLSVIQEYVDRKFPEGEVKLILSGSNVSFMKELLENKSNPLYKRATFKINVRKMSLKEAVLFFDGIDDESVGNYLSLFGTHPYYLSMIDKNLSFEENIKKLVFSKYGVLVDAPLNVLPIGASTNQMFNSILYDISKRKRFPKEIAEILKIDSNYLSTYLKTLCEMEIIEKREMFKAGKKNNYYVIRDSFLEFYYKFVFDYKELISLGGGERCFESFKDEFYAFLGHGFEDVVNQYMNEENLNGNLPYFYGQLQSYNVDNSKLGRSIEIDGLAEDIKGKKESLLVIESKYRNKNTSKEVLDHLRESISIFEGYKDIEIYLFSKYGFSDDLLSLNDPHVHLRTLRDIVSDK